MYIRRWHIAILNIDFHLCIYILKRHVDIPCHHFFMILRIMRENKHEFNIAQIHLHWHLSHELSRSQNRPWISIHRVISDNESRKVMDVILIISEKHSFEFYAIQFITHDESDDQYLLFNSSHEKDDDEIEMINLTPSFHPQNAETGNRSPS